MAASAVELGGAPLVSEDPPPSNSNGAQRTPEELVAKAIAPIKKEFLRPPPVRPASASSQNDAVADSAPADNSKSGIVKDKKSKRQLKRERRQVWIIIWPLGFLLTAVILS